MIHQMALFLGRFHPLLVHLPIGGLVLLAFLEAVAKVTPWKESARNNAWILGFVTAAACAASACGLMLAQSGGYDAQLLKSHRLLGIAVSVACSITFVLRCKQSFRAYQISLAVTLACLVLASHIGGTITHGRGFLTAHAPSPIRSLLGDLRGHQSGGSEYRASPDDYPVFTSAIQPILNARCSACHGPEKHKADLRLDTLEDLKQGGQDGAVIADRNTQDSLLIQRILLPLDADGHMPPDGQAQPTPEEITLLEWWVKSGAPARVSLDHLKADPRTRHLFEVVARRPDWGN